MLNKKAVTSIRDNKSAAAGFLGCMFAFVSVCQGFFSLYDRHSTLENIRTLFSTLTSCSVA